MDWLDHDRLGFNYRLSEIACAIGLAQLDRLDGLLAARRARRRRLPRGARRRSRGSSCRAPTRAASCAAGSSTRVALPRGVDRDATIRRLRERGVQSKPYLPAIHLMSYYRESFGHRPGEFPVCEDVAARSLALPFLPELSEGEVERVAAALAAALRLRCRLTMSRFSEPQHPDFQAINASLEFDRRLWPLRRRAVARARRRCSPRSA